MNTRFPPQVPVFLMGLALCLVFTSEVTAEQEGETPAPEIVSPSSDNSAALSPEKSADSGIEESDASTLEEMADEAEPLSPAEEAYQRALEHEKNNELDEAIVGCTEAIRLDAKNPEYLISRGELHGEMRNYDKALEDAAKILETDPTNLRARLLRAKMLELSGDPEKALTEFNAAVEQNPTSWQALFERQNHFERQGQHDKTLADGDRMIQVQPELAAGYLSKAMSHASSGEFDQATNYASALIQQNPENPLAYMTRATARAAQGDDAGAKQDFDAAVKLSPDNAFILNARGAFYFVTGDYEKSLADLQKAMELQPRNYGFKASIADFLATCPDEHLRSGARAAEYANDALRLAPNDPVVWRACASAAAENGNFEEAVKWQERLLGSKGMTPDRKSEGERRFEAYKSGQPYRVNLPPSDEVLAYKKMKDANNAINNNNFDRAIALLSEVIATDPKNAGAYTGRGIACYKQNKYDLAIADLTAGIQRNPKEVDTYFYRARAFEKTRQYAKALDDLLMVEKLDPEGGMDMPNNLAWFFATCPDDRVRNGGKAAEYIDQALELRPNEPAIWDTCAAVFAEIGDFDDAVEWENAYLERKDVSEEQRRDGEKRLTLYIQHQPYRNEPQQTASDVTASTTPAQPGK